MASHIGVIQQQTDQLTCAPKIQNRHCAAARAAAPTKSNLRRVVT
jgi:hypothetical protein